MPNPVNTADDESRKDEQVTFRLTQARHRAALRTLAKARGLSKHALAKELLESALERSDQKDNETIELLRLEIAELRTTMQTMQNGTATVLAGLLSFTPNAKGERMSLMEAEALVLAAFEKGENRA